MAASTRDEHARLLDAEEGDEASVQKKSTVADAPTPLPWRPLIVILLLNAMQPLAFEIVFPFVNQMIVEIGVVTDPERVGFYSGLIESIFSCMSFIAILPVSYLSDIVGRKPVILGGMFGLAVSVASFGMSKSYLAMVLSRCLGGALGGVWACTRIMLGEMTDKSNQGGAFSLLNLACRMGQIIGLPLGGLLAHPERNFPLFRTKFWYEYPFALPCFVASALAFGAVVMGYFSLEETLPSKRKPMQKPSTYGSITVPHDATCASSVAAENVEAEGSPPDSETIDKTIHKPSLKAILTPSIVSLLISNVAMCLVAEALFAVFPLFAFTPIASGGLGMSEAAIGAQMGIRAVLHIGIMGFFGPLQRRLGTVRLYQLVMWSWPLAVIGFPLLNYLRARQGVESSWPFTIGLFVFFLLWAFSGLGWIAITIMVTDATPSSGALAMMNGASQMAIVLPQAVAPASVTSLFAVSIKSGIAGGNLIWIILFALACAAAMHSLTLREPRSDWRQDSKISQSARR